LLPDPDHLHFRLSFLRELYPCSRPAFKHDARLLRRRTPRTGPLEAHLNGVIEAQQRAEEEQASQHSPRAIQRAFREALLVLPPEEYDWFNIQAHARTDVLSVTTFVPHSVEG
jgi:hypothetical protein